MRDNTKGVFLMSTAFVRAFDRVKPDSGRIVNIASGAGRRGYPGQSVYCASKAGAISLTQSMAMELKGRRITVNAVCPGLVATARAAAALARGQVPERESRVGRPYDIARAVRFLADPDADHITGQSLNVDGGLILS
jgi:NAD(P)-dependent dehydrogenase (short-subunit alcohol dehydrogenase family)